MTSAKRKIVALLLCAAMIFTNAITAFGAEAKSTQKETSVEWTSEDFVYTDYEKLLYGCDYTREIVIKGRAIAGFSEAGEEKLKVCKDLVLPAVDDKGETLIAVANSAFYKKGLTSVTFPTGMMASYEDTITNKITKRGNFVIAESAFAGNQLKEVVLPEGVIACLPYAFNANKLETVKLPRTLWWIETMSFANNRLKTVDFSMICDFQLEMHGMAFAKNFIESVRLPDYTEVVNKDTFLWNTGKEPLADGAKDAYKSYEVEGVTYDAGVVYMYTDNAALAAKDRIHHTGKATSSQKSYAQKLVVNDGTQATKNPDQAWTIDDFAVDGTVITGLSESGKEKRKTQKHLVIPELNANGKKITEIAAASPGGHGLFATAAEGFDTVYLPSGVKKIGAYAFQNNGLKEITFPHRLETIETVAFQSNQLTSVILPDTVTTLGNGAFATNPKLERINLSKGLTEITEAAFGCSTKTEYMTNLTEIELHEGITKIGKRAFAGNNFHEIEIPSTVKVIDDYAFSTKNYLKEPCTVVLNEGLETIGSYAFRNKVINEVYMPSTVKNMAANTFCKEYSDNTEVIITKVFVSQKSQYEDHENFPASEYHRLYLTSSLEWTAEDFTYGQQEGWAITGFSEEGLAKIEINKNLLIPAKDPDGKAVEKIGNHAFAEKELLTVRIPDGITAIGDCAFSNNRLVNVTFPASLAVIGVEAFAENEIAEVEFPEVADASFQIKDKAFAGNNLKEVQLPANTEKVEKDVFSENAGMVVYMYLDAKKAGEGIACKSNGTSEVQDVILGLMAPEKRPWGVEDFTYDETGTVITGLSEAGKAKIKVNPEVKLPAAGPKGEAILALGDGVSMQGIFTYEDEAEGKYYAPSGILLPITLKKIGKFAFALNAGVSYEAEMMQIRLPEGLEEIAMSAFQNSKLTSIVIPDSVSVMGQGTFTGSSKLTSVKLPAGMKEIPTAMFNAGSSTDMKMAEIVIPEGIEKIGEYAFSGVHVEKLTLPSTLKEIGNSAFWNHQLEELEIPGSVTAIGEYAFRISQESLSSTLKTLELNYGLETIGKGAFWGCAVTQIDLPDTVVLSAQNGSDDGIFGWERLPADPIVKVKVSSEEKVKAYNTNYANKYSHVVVLDKLVGTGWKYEDFTFDEETGTLTGWSESGHKKRMTQKNLVLPDLTPEGKEIVEIGDEAFKIPDDEVIITKFGVDSPGGMISVDLPKHVKELGKEALSQNALTEIDLTGLIKIGESALYGNDLAAVELPDTVTEIGMGAFATNDITDLKLSDSLTVIPQGAFSMNIRMEKVIIPDAITEIGATAFAGARLTELTIPENVTKIGMKAFHLHHLSELTIPGNVKEIGESAFEGTFKATTLTKLTIEEGVESIGKYAFKEALLETVHFPDSIKNVGIGPFQNNKGKDGSQVVEVTTTNPEHLTLKDKTYVVKYLGELNIADYKDAIKVAYKSMAYTGALRKPAVTIEGLNEGTDYTVKYENNKYPGTAVITITGIGNYVGTVQKTFTIKKPVVAAQKSVNVNLYGYDDIKATWSSQTVKGATVKYKVQYKVYGGSFKTLNTGTMNISSKKANLEDGKRYCVKVTPYVVVNGKTYTGTAKTSSYVYTLKKIGQPKLSKSGTKVKVKWTNINGETGYQISRAKGKNATNIVKTIKGSNLTSALVSAEKGKTFYYKVRAYKTVDGKKIFGPWSAVRAYKR